MKPSKPIGTEFTRAEAVDVLAQCKAIRWSVQALEQRAHEALRKPELKVIHGSKTDKEIS